MSKIDHEQIKAAARAQGMTTRNGRITACNGIVDTVINDIESLEFKKLSTGLLIEEFAKIQADIVALAFMLRDEMLDRAKEREE